MTEIFSSIWSFVISYAYPILISIVLFLIFFFIIREAAKKRVENEAVRKTILVIIKGPLAVAIVGYGFYYFVENFGYLITPYVSAYGIRETTIEFILELIFLIVGIDASRRIGRIWLKQFEKLSKRHERLLLIGIYSLGLMTFVYIVITSPLSAGVYNFFYPLANFLTGIAITYMAVYIINVLIVRYQTAIEGKQVQAQTTITFLRRIIIGIVAIIGSAIAAFSSFPSVSASVASLFVAAGFTSIVVGLAAQSTLSNLIAGGVIAFSQPFRIGDAISYANEWAWVEDIKLTFTVLRTWDNRRLVVPNQMFLNSTTINYDLNDSTKLCVVYVTITYESDLDKAMGILKEIASEHPDFLPSGNLPVVHVMDFTDGNTLDGVHLRLLSRAKDQSTNFQMSKDILYQIKKKFDANGIELAYPRRQIVVDPNSRRNSVNSNGNSGTGDTDDIFRNNREDSSGSERKT